MLVLMSAWPVQSGYTWTVTFSSAVGDVEQMVVTDALTGIGHGVVVNTTRPGNTIGGTYRVSFLGAQTRRIPVNATEEELENILQVMRQQQ